MRAGKLEIGALLFALRGTVEEMAGRIWLESQVDQRSTFFFTVAVKIGRQSSLPAESRLSGLDA